MGPWTVTRSESQRRSAAYTEDDWIAIKAEAGASINGFAEAIRSGEPSTGQLAMDLAEARNAPFGSGLPGLGVHLA